MDHNCQRLTASITIPTSLPVQEAEGSLAFLFFSILLGFALCFDSKCYETQGKLFKSIY